MSKFTVPEHELLGAALPYVAVADWFEARPVGRKEEAHDAQAMAVFSRIEAELRVAGGRVLRASNHRQLVLQAAMRE